MTRNEGRKRLRAHRERWLRRLAGVLAAVVGAGALMAAWPAASWAQGPVRIDLMVSRLSKKPGKIDPRAAKLHQQLQGEFRYESLEVVKSVELTLALDEVGTMDLPTGKKVQVRPLLIDDRGVLLAVEVEDSVKTDLRVQSDHLVIIGTERHEKGKLVISLEPHL